MINSLLDNDKYAFMMSYAFYKCWPDMQVTYEFKNRSIEINLAEKWLVTALETQIELVRKKWFTKEELEWLAAQHLNDPAWLKMLGKMQLPEVVVRANGQWLSIEYTAEAHVAVFWESMLLAMLKEIYVAHFADAAIWKDALQRARNKAALFGENNISIHEFGTRRRASAAWQQSMLELFLTIAPKSISSTSNACLAKQYNLAWSGTIAHQVYMLRAAINLQHYQYPLDITYAEVYKHWTALFANDFKLCMLPDTFTTAHFMRACAVEQLRTWPMTRIDSGEPVNIAHMVLARLHALDVKLKEHTLLFSDALDANKMLMLKHVFNDVCEYEFGYGTGFSADLAIAGPNIVIKPAMVNGLECCKLSDDLSKAHGSATTIEKYKELINA